MVNETILSEKDKSVLNAIFNPLQVGGDAEQTDYNEELPEQLQDPFEEATPNVIESIQIEMEAVNACELKNYDLALALFQKAIDTAPNRPAPYNNRAQAYRLLENDSAALSDLEEALKLSNSMGRSGCKALCQRGLLRRKVSDTEGAKEDFEKAAKLGSQFARTQLIELNPYAALCNQMLRDVFEKLY